MKKKYAIMSAVIATTAVSSTYVGASALDNSVISAPIDETTLFTYENLSGSVNLVVKNDQGEFSTVFSGENAVRNIIHTENGELLIRCHLENNTSNRININAHVYMPHYFGLFGSTPSNLAIDLEKYNQNPFVKDGIRVTVSSEDTNTVPINGTLDAGDSIDVDIPLKKLDSPKLNEGRREEAALYIYDSKGQSKSRSIYINFAKKMLSQSDLNGKYLGVFAELDENNRRIYKVAPDYIQERLPLINHDTKGNYSKDVTFHNFYIDDNNVGPESEDLYFGGTTLIDLTNIKKSLEGTGVSVYQNFKDRPSGWRNFPNGFWSRYTYTYNGNNVNIQGYNKEQYGQILEYIELHEIIKTKDLELKVGQNWDKYDNLIETISPFDYKKMDKSVLSVTHNVNTNKAGVYNVRYTFTDEFTGEKVYRDAKVVVKDVNAYVDKDGGDNGRISGDDRIETSVEVSKNTYPNGTKNVILANKDKYTDIMTAVPLSIQLNAPILFTNTDSLPSVTEHELARLNAKNVYISGGVESVSRNIEKSLKDKKYTTHRFNGVDRYDTAKLIADMVRENGSKTKVEIASGQVFPDALSISSLAVKDNAPILLVKKDSIPQITKNVLDSYDPTSISIAGGESTVSKSVENDIKTISEIKDAKNIERLGGVDRYDTSAIIANRVYPSTSKGVYTSGEKFADALVAGPYAAIVKAPVLLVKKNSMPSQIQSYEKKAGIIKRIVVGGLESVGKYIDIMK